MNILISAVICTYKRSEYLRKAIQSLIDQTLPGHLYEILVIDNAFDDDTRRIIHYNFAGVKNLRYDYEQNKGTAFARNKGYRMSRGTYVAFLDDDAIASSDWLERIVEAFNVLGAEPACIGGKVLPVWVEPRPAWLSKYCEYCVGILDYDKMKISLNIDGPFLGGGNMALPRVLLDKANGFNTMLGKRGRRPFTGEDTLLQMELMEMGYRCIYDPRIVIRHHILRERLKQSYCYSWAFFSGISKSLIRMQFEPFRFHNRLREIASGVEEVLRKPMSIIKLMTRANTPEDFLSNFITMIKLGRMAGFFTRRFMRTSKREEIA
ncbi:MAG: glycosyltransferase family 2 protein [Candidatus Omnitrophica bacterium]|nr:glycosyltransferase family 2 protein [Candidatus Omnitrophota bacterium]